MISHWQEAIGSNSTILHLGDLALGTREQIESLGKLLPGKKYLIRGNHDKRSRGFYRSIGFELIEPFDISFGDFRVRFTHYPDDDFVNESNFHLNVHGHIHSRLRENPRFINASVEHTNFKPIAILDLLEKRLNNTT